ncbi:MAG TPA: efflux RND transporter permease subunit [Bryobacteraceae bacterium]|nr:efflux RND transporter permease subunit [Bryobacteraceae bacterium]
MMTTPNNTVVQGAGPQETGVNAPHWTAHLARPILFIIITLIGMGIYLSFTIPVAVFPATNFPKIIVGVDNGVAPIDQMQVTVTRPLEEAMNSVPGLETVRSITSRGSVDISLFFNWNVDMFQTLQYVNAAISRVQPDLPATAKITANRMTFAAVSPILGYSLTSDSVPQTDLWELATYGIKPRLNRVPGVSMVILQGGQVPEFEVVPDPAKLQQAQITIPNILDSITQSNMIDSPGLLENNHELSLALVTGQAKTPQDVGNIVVKTTQAGLPVRIGDVADVRHSVMPVYTIVTANGKPAVLLNLFRQPDSNTVAVTDAVDKELTDIRKNLPPNVKLDTYYDQSLLVRASIASVRDAIVIGLILAAIILVIFLRDWGSSIVAGLVIPATIAITLIVLRVLGESFDLMTLGGLAAAVGLVIDDAIVVVENIVLHRDHGESRGEAIRRALKEIRVPLIGSTITPIVVFIPLVTISGVTGTFFRALAVTVGTALLTSLALALTWTPTLSHFLLRRGKGDQKSPEVLSPAEVSGEPPASEAPASVHEHAATTGIMGKVTRFYVRVLHFALDKWPVMLLGSAALIAVSWFCYTRLGSDLLPEMDEGGFVLDYLMPAGSSLQDTNQVLLGVEKILAATPEVESTSRRTGLQLGLAAVTEANTGDFLVKLKQDRDRGIDEVMDDVRQKVSKAYPQLDIEFAQVLQDQIGDLTSSPEPIEIKLFSPDPKLLEKWGPKIADRIKKIPLVADVKDGIEDSISGPAIIMTVDPATAARAGFTPREIELDASAILQGEPANLPAVVNDRSYTIRVRFPESVRTSLDQIRNTIIVSSTGKTATLGSVADFSDQAGQTEIWRENLLRYIAVTGRFDGTSLGQGMQQVQKAVGELNVPPEIGVTYGGVYAEQQKSFHDLLVVLALAVILVFTVLLFEFRAFAAPTAILASALLSTSGVFFALLVTNTTFNISSFMGLIMVVGIVAKNGILLLDAEERFRSEGMAAREAMTEAGARRLRPILMTAMATVAGMIPLSLGIGQGSQMLQPLAIAVIGGILASMVLSLLVTPVVFFLGNRRAA